MVVRATPIPSRSALGALCVRVGSFGSDDSVTYVPKQLAAKVSLVAAPCEHFVAACAIADTFSGESGPT